MTLDADVERLLRTAMRERGTSFKEALNQAVRDGFSKTRPKKRKFVQKTYDMGAAQLFRWDKALSIAEAMEDEELVRRMALDK